MPLSSLFFFFTGSPTTELYTLSLHDALPICRLPSSPPLARRWPSIDQASTCTRSGEPTSARALHVVTSHNRSEEHTSELQSPYDLVCRLLLEKKKNARKTKSDLPNSCPAART